MAYGEYYVERQGWAHWPKTLIMCRKRGDGIERRRYVPETELQMTRDELREECQCADMAEMKLLHHMGVFESVKDTNADLRRMLHEKDADNAKLRELVRELFEDQCADGDEWKYRDRLRELGVEVDDG